VYNHSAVGFNPKIIVTKQIRFSSAAILFLIKILFIAYFFLISQSCANGGSKFGWHWARLILAALEELLLDQLKKPL